MPNFYPRDIPTLLISNIAPHPSVIPHILSTVKSLDDDLAKLHHTLKYRTQAEKRQILTEREHILEIRRKYASVISPVRRLSDKLLEKIIRYNAYNHQELCTYMLVCWNWNMVASYFIHHWNDIQINLCYDVSLDSIQINDLPLVAHHFERARPLPMDVTIDYNFDGGIFYNKSNRVLNQLGNHQYWRSLASGPSAIFLLMHKSRRRDLSSLEEIVICSKQGQEELRLCGLDIRALVSLTRLTIHVEDRIHNSYPGGILVDWFRLTHLDLDGLYSEASDYLDILAAALFLEVCTLKLHKSAVPIRCPPVPVGYRLVLPKLREFSLNGKECPTLFLKYIATPRLQMLEITWKEAHDLKCAPGQEISRFIVESKCKLHSFSLQSYNILFSDLEMAMKTMISVECVTLRISNSNSLPIINKPLGENDYSV
ncbi:hypothetical protein JR316_0004174 [Psilocybe cubensis]|uniref:F-box domain-containing protein n=2 Tax=Psilocybe cubensis TaxID=181762 RepID=A0A8H8CL27_PSICU|nr:hypothetical protein JR316_0004174 [Psilocybe cubensis]KAH9482079.1 hypothetical protein JR316_0004174 [Psilocybe cubensis]